MKEHFLGYCKIQICLLRPHTAWLHCFAARHTMVCPDMKITMRTALTSFLTKLYMIMYTITVCRLYVAYLLKNHGSFDCLLVIPISCSVASRYASFFILSMRSYHH